MSISEINALYARELQALENALALTTAMPQEPYADFCVPLATGMSLVISATTLRPWSEVRSTSVSPRR